MLTLDEFLSIIRVYLDTFVADWRNQAETEPVIFPLEQGNFDEWLENFIIFIAEQQADKEEYYNEFS